MSVLVLIPAAGSGTRFGGGIPKQFQPIGGKPMVQYVVERFLLDEAVDRIVVAVAEPLLTIVKQTPDDRVQFVAGGETRQQSVARALAAARGTFDVVAVHDAVRPFFRLSTFHAVIDAARERGVAFPAMPVPDTVHKTRDDVVDVTLDRRSLVLAQTPQCFRYDILRDVLARAEDQQFDATDEAGLAAKFGYEVKVVPGDSFNMKITRPEDLRLAEAHFEEWSRE